MWSPNDQRIAFSSTRNGGYGIHVMDADGRDVARLTDSQADDWGPTWAPDGTPHCLHKDCGGATRHSCDEVRTGPM